MFHVCSFCLAMTFYIKTSVISGIFFGEPDFPFDD